MNDSLRCILILLLIIITIIIIIIIIIMVMTIIMIIMLMMMMKIITTAIVVEMINKIASFLSGPLKTYCKFRMGIERCDASVQAMFDVFLDFLELNPESVFPSHFHQLLVVVHGWNLFHLLAKTV